MSAGLFSITNMSFWDNIASRFGYAPIDEFVTYINRVLNAGTDYKTFVDDQAKLSTIFSNPAVLKVFSLQCDMFSLGKVYVYKEGKAIDTDPFLDMIKRPNPFQTHSQFQWDFMFFNMLGNAYCYCDSNRVEENNKLYILENQKMTFSPEFDKYKDMIVLSNSTQEAINKLSVSYSQSKGTAYPIQWGK